MIQLDVFKRKLLQLLDENGFSATYPVFEEIKQSGFQYDKPALAHLEQEALSPVTDQNNFITRLKVFIGRISGGSSNVRHPGIPLRPPYFIGRGKQLNKIHELLADPSGRLPILLLSGIGGMGKTTLMQEYLHQDACQQYFDRIVFVSVDKNLNTAFVDGACAALGLDEKKRQAKFLADQLNLVIQEMKKKEGNNLFVIDNVNERDFEDLRNIRAAFIQTGWKFLITTRTAPDEFVALDVDELDMEDAVLLFVYHNTTTQIDHIDPARINEQLRNVIDKEGIKAKVDNLLTHIVRHTLLTELLAKAGKKKGLSLDQLLVILEKLDLSHPDLQRVIHVPHAGHTFREQLNTSSLHVYLLNLFETEYLEQKTGNNVVDAENEARATMLRFFSVLPSSDIPIDDLKVLWRVPQDGANVFENRLDEIKQIGWIQGKHQVEPVGLRWQNLAYKMHPLVKEVVYKKLKPDINTCRPLVLTVTEILSGALRNPQAYQGYAESIIDKLDLLHKKYNSN